MRRRGQVDSDGDVGGGGMREGGWDGGKTVETYEGGRLGGGGDWE